MEIRVRGAFLLILFLGSGSFAHPLLDPLGERSLQQCQQELSQTCRGSHPGQDLQVTLCAINFKASQCGELLHEFPQLKPMVQDCDSKHYCESRTATNAEMEDACLASLRASSARTVTNLASLIERGWAQLMSHQPSSQVLADCDKSVASKRALAKTDFRNRDLSDEALAKTSCLALYLRAKELDAITPPPAEPSEQDLLAYRDQVNQFKALYPQAQSQLDFMLEISEAKLARTVQKWSCYTPKARLAMMCYAVGAVMDPSYSIPGFAALEVLKILKVLKPADGTLGTLVAMTEAPSNPTLTATKDSLSALTKYLDGEKAKEQERIQNQIRIQEQRDGKPMGRETKAFYQRIYATGSDLHSLVVKNGKVTLQIGELKFAQKDFMRVVIQAVRDGKIDVIDAGDTRSPKALSLILRLSSFAPAGKSMILTGKINPSYLEKAFAIAKKDRQVPDAKRDAINNWSQTEIDNFSQAKRQLKLIEACQNIYKTDLDHCGRMSYSLDVSRADQITWAAAPQDKTEITVQSILESNSESSAP